MESSLVSVLDVGTGSCHPLRTADPTAVTAGRLLSDKELRIRIKGGRGFCALPLLFKIFFGLTS